MTHPYNPARQVAADSFRACLQNLHGQADISEQKFADQWRKEMLDQEFMSTTGWYVPPANGLSVLAGGTNAVSRISFNSLREEKNWPSKRMIDWDECLYVYCSPVDIRTGLIGDFAITLYFGDSTKIQDHFVNAYTATRRILAIAKECTQSLELFARANSVFREHGLSNEGLSVTDATPNNLGHSCPILPVEQIRGRDINADARNTISRSRKFINAVSDWPLNSVGQYTIEPQLCDRTNPELPKVSFHYVINTDPFHVLDEPDAILDMYGLTSTTENR